MHRRRCALASRTSLRTPWCGGSWLIRLLWLGWLRQNCSALRINGLPDIFSLSHGLKRHDPSFPVLPVGQASLVRAHLVGVGHGGRDQFGSCSLIVGRV